MVDALPGTRANDGDRRELAQKMMRRVRKAREVLKTVDQAMIMDLLARQECTPEPDGMPLRSPGSGEAGGGGSDDWTPTERSALHGLPGDQEDDTRPDVVQDRDGDGVAGPDGRPIYNQRTVPDPVGLTIVEALEMLDRGTTEIGRAARKIEVVRNTAAAFRGRVSTGGDCVLCGDHASGAEGDRIVSGLDHKCYNRWSRLPRPRMSVPDWVAFERAKRMTEEAYQAAEQRLIKRGELRPWGSAEKFYSDEEAEIERLRAAGELPTAAVQPEVRGQCLTRSENT